jgi:hypothetical protein
MSKHSKGEWTLAHFASQPASGCPCGYVFAGDGCFAVAEVLYHNDTDRFDQYPPVDEAKANARLISAAPDLLAYAQAEEALDRWVRHATTVEDTMITFTRLGWIDDTGVPIISQLRVFTNRLRRTAIAKAEISDELERAR